MFFVKEGPVFLQRVTVTGNDVVWENPAHHQIHAGEVVCIFLELLGVVLNVVLSAHALGRTLANVDQQGTGAAGGVIDFDLVAVFQVIGHDLRHQQGNLMRGIELPGLFTGICREVADQVLINEAQNVIILFAVHGNVLDQLKQVADRLGSCAGGVAQLAQTGIKGIKNLLENLFVFWIDQAIERRERVGDIGDVKVLAFGQPCGEEMFIGDKIAKLAAAVSHSVRIVLGEFLQVIALPAVFAQKLFFLIREEFIENKAKNIVLVLIGLNF